MRTHYHVNIPAELADVQPHGDYVLVRRLPDRETTESGLIWIPQHARDPKTHVPRRGVVVAVGKGDRLIGTLCSDCDMFASRLATARNWRCVEPECESHPPLDLDGTESRAPMHVEPGDHIIYWRAPSNDIRINGEEYVFLHEEQHIVAVIDEDADLRLEPIPSRMGESMFRPASELLEKMV